MMTMPQFSNHWVSPHAYKRQPVFPLVNNSLSFTHSTAHSAHSSCQRCFPQVSTPVVSDYVDLLEFSSFGGQPWPLAPGVKPPSRWAADLRYTLSTPILHSYPRVHDRVLRGKRVNEAIEQMATTELTPRKLRAKAGAFFIEIRASLNRLVCRVCGYLLFKVFRKLCSRLLVVPTQLQAIKKAEDSGVPIVYLPLHRSHLDYLLITWCNWHFGLRLPHIASGDNLNLSGFGWLLRATGAFFIRRRMDPNDEGGRDQLYRTVLHSYIDELLSNKMSVEFFLEGTRSRFGKPLHPKNGLISNVIEAVQQGVIPDCYLVPVSISYDQVAEGIFLNELMGVPKTRENLWMVLKGMAKGFDMLPCGTVRMNFGSPVLLTEYIASISECVHGQNVIPARLRRKPSAYSYRELMPWNSPSIGLDRALVRGIGLHVIWEAAHIGSVHLVSIAAAVFLCKYRQGGERDEIARDMQWLCDRLVRQGTEVVGWVPTHSSGARALSYADKFLADVIETSNNSNESEDDYIRPVNTHRALVKLAYSRNSILPHFALKAAVALALSPHRPGDVIPVETVLEEALDICEWMHFEVLFCKPCESLRNELEYVLLGADPERSFGCPQTGPVQWQRSYEEGHEGTVKIRECARARDLLLFHSNLLRPFFQSYALVVTRLLNDPKPVKEQEFVRETIKNTLAKPNDTVFPLWLEAVNSDSMRNGISVLRERGVLSAAGTPISALSIEMVEHASDQLHKILSIAKYDHE